ncbi:MAG: 2'-5' RNA ligase family protein [Acidobacteriota bacterium]|nr:2'-5' RNA ligase family protein [Acidobacteriota bacterium]
MSSVEAAPAQLKQFALVSYISGPLGDFLDRLRLELVPDCSPHAHVTLLPPRPICGCASEAADELRNLTRRFPNFDVELGAVEIFPVSKVVYIGLKRGEEELHRMYEALNQGAVHYREPYPYHPHITLVQNVIPDQVPHMFDVAQKRWAEYRGPRTFSVRTLDFVKNLYGSCWKDLANIDLLS